MIGHFLLIQDLKQAGETARYRLAQQVGVIGAKLMSDLCRNLWRQRGHMTGCAIDILRHNDDISTIEVPNAKLPYGHVASTDRFCWWQSNIPQVQR
jgi:hypothetical protein